MARKIEIEFDGKTIPVTVDFAVVERIEDRFDLMTFLRSVQSFRSKKRDIAWVLYCALREAGEKYTYPDVGEIVHENTPDSLSAATEIATTAMQAGPEKPSTQKKTDQPPPSETTIE